MRFGVVAVAWRHPSGAAAPVDAVDVAAGVAGVARPLVWAAAGEDEIALWDVAAGTCRHALKVGRARRARDEHAMDDAEFTADVAALSYGGRLTEAPRASAFRDWAPVAADLDSSPSPDAVYRADELRDAPPGSEGARCVLVLQSGAVLSGGSDACVRLWCPGDASRSRVIAGPLAPRDRPRYEERRVAVPGVADSSLAPLLRESPPPLSARHQRLAGRLAGDASGMANGGDGGGDGNFTGDGLDIFLGFGDLGDFEGDGDVPAAAGGCLTSTVAPCSATLLTPLKENTVPESRRGATSARLCS